jgi:hypothetical protein
MTGPPFVLSYPDRDAFEADGCDAGAWDLCHTVLGQWACDSYTTARISYTPDPGDVAAMRSASVSVPVPGDLLLPTPGDDLDTRIEAIVKSGAGGPVP